MLSEKAKRWLITLKPMPISEWEDLLEFHQKSLINPSHIQNTKLKEDAEALKEVINYLKTINFLFYLTIFLLIVASVYLVYKINH